MNPDPRLLAALRDHELEFIADEHRSEQQHCNIWRAMEVSVRAPSGE